MHKQRKRGQQQISMGFGMIFSIILIIVFLVVAFIVIKHFLGLQKCTEIGSFVKNDLETKVDEVWKSTSKTTTIKIQLPGNIEKICFVNFTQPSRGTQANKEIYNSLERDYSYYEPNFIFYPAETASSCGIPYAKIPHMNMEEIIKEENPYCITNKKINNENPEMIIEKGFYEKEIIIKRK